MNELVVWPRTWNVSGTDVIASIAGETHRDQDAVLTGDAVAPDHVRLLEPMHPLRTDGADMPVWRPTRANAMAEPRQAVGVAS